MTPQQPTNGDLALRFVDGVIEDLSVGVPIHLSRRSEDEATDTFVIEEGGGRDHLRLPWPDLSSPASVAAVVHAMQQYVANEVQQAVPRCPLHAHPLEVLADLSVRYDWVCPAGQWRCRLGEYAEQAWPNFPQSDLASILGRRMKKRGIAGVRSWGVSAGPNGLVASFAVKDLNSELVGALTAVAAPIEVDVHEHPRQPRRRIEPVRELLASAAPPAVRLVLSQTVVQRGGRLPYTVVNDAASPVLTGLAFELDQQEDGWWYAIDTELLFRAVGHIIDPGRQREYSAMIPARAAPGIYRLRKNIRPTPSLSHPSNTFRADPEMPTQITAEFSVIDAGMTRGRNVC